MYFDSVAALIAMDGHGLYVWGVVAIWLLTLGSQWLVPCYSHQQFYKLAAQQQRRNEDSNAPS